MTSSAPIEKNTPLPRALISLTCPIIAVILIIFGSEVKAGIYKGLIFSFTTVIPTLFPFFILSDIWVKSCCTEGIFSRITERIFGISGVSFSAIVTGLICGFPIGIKTASELYRREIISKDELEHLCGFVNNPSPAFVISGIGAAMMGSVSAGIRLCLSVMLSAFAIGIIFRKKHTSNGKTDFISRQNFDLAESIRSAGLTSLNVTSCIALFGGIINMVSIIAPNKFISASVSAILEITNAAKSICDLSFKTATTKYMAISFALGFSGMSAHIQAFSFMPKEISRPRYLAKKLLQGIICSLFSLLLFLI